MIIGDDGELYPQPNPNPNPNPNPTPVKTGMDPVLKYTIIGVVIAIIASLIIFT